MKTRYLLLFGFLLFTCTQVTAQLDTKHWIPPFYAKPGANTGTSNIQKHFVSLSTPSEDTIPVTIRNGYGEIVNIIEISRNAPAEYTLGPIGNANTNTYPLNVIPTDSLNLKIRSQGLYFESYQPFFVNMRHKSGSQGTSLTSKGQIAKGKRFYSGHVYNRYNNDNSWNLERRSHFISVMATEDNTIVTFDMIKAPITYVGQTPGEPITVVLDAFESYVIGIDHGQFDNSTINLANGTRITSTKNIVCNTGSWLAGNEIGQCIGSDQLVPAEITGQEYILVRGLGDESTERPIVIATEDNTEVYLNDGATPVANLDEGEFYIIPTADFTANDNLYVLATNKVYLYQTLSGSATNIGQTVGLSFIPPLNCIGAKEVNLPFVNSLSGGTGQGRINIITKAGTSVYVNENPTPITGAQPVTGNADWVTYAFNSPSDNVIIESDSVMNVALLTRDNNVGTAGYFSGFTLEPVVGLSSGVSGTLPCIPGNAVLQVFGFDTYQWYFNGEELPGATDNTLFPEFAGNYVVEGIDLACGFRFPSNNFAIPFCPSTLGAAKQVQNVAETAPGSKIFDVTYRIFIENLAFSPSENIQVIENINGGLPVGATAELIGSPSIAFGILSGGVNPAFDGVTVKQLLPGNGSLPGSAADAIDLIVRVDMNAAVQDGYFNQVTVTSKNGVINDGVNGPFNGQDFSHVGSNPDLNGNGEPNEEGENTPTLTCFFPNDIEYGQTSFCANESLVPVELNGVNSGVYTVDIPGLSIDSVSGTIDPSQSAVGTYAVTFTTTGRCPTVTSTEVTIEPAPIAGNSISLIETCAGSDPVNLFDYIEGEDEGGAWTNAGGTEIDSIYDPSIAGNFGFTYTVGTAPCDPVSVVITLNVLPEPNPGVPIDDTSVCLSDGNINLFDFVTGEQTGGQWIDSDNNPISADVTLTEPGLFGYSYVVTNSACGSRTSSFNLNVIAVPDAGVSVGNADVCAGEDLNLFDYLVDPDLDGYWIDQDANIVNDETRIDNAGAYVYTYIIDRSPCESDSTAVSFNVELGPSAGIPQNPLLVCISDPAFNLIDYVSGATPGGVWTNADGTVINGVFDPETTGVFTFTYTVTSPECGDIASDLIVNVSQANCTDKTIVIPQGFSPNNDGIGDIWIVRNIEQYPNSSLLIFNRWGEEVFTARPYTNNWEGKADGGLNSDNGLPVGTYYYVLDLGDGTDIRKGYIYLNR
ncbi:gliding motility-associated C-terminal domain-containing protein [Cryomorpha ignava]|uniref:Gliding motility-associated C-terminal domain-containing protein n=1 Tax=Cryomorpha ignava TaxID=101383 RepID=A0A7K3WJZ8_9FLAO|nr:gliding motility-associated C-terminal domain-containing protein [Cryomorpha ignava]NEN21970.1 gliding motility-associated C-terminal domain-containing protein [Cryomorpha ignava]